MILCWKVSHWGRVMSPGIRCKSSPTTIFVGKGKVGCSVARDEILELNDCSGALILLELFGTGVFKFIQRTFILSPLRRHSARKRQKCTEVKL